MLKVGANNKRLSIEYIKNKIYNIDKDIIILDEDYINSKYKMSCECTICDNVFSKSWNEFDRRKKGCPSCSKNGAKVTKEDIEKQVKQLGYNVVEFISNDSNKGTVFNIKCSNGHVYETNYRRFFYDERRSGSCKLCNQESIGSARRKEISQVLDNLKEWGYTVPKEFVYKNSLEVHIFTCASGHRREISYHSLERTPHCPECNGNPLKHDDKNLIDILSKYNLKYLGGYTGAESKFHYECECGEIAHNTLKSIRKGIRCRKCNKHKRYLLEDVKECFESENYTLLTEEYIDNKQHLRFICDNGHEGKVNFNSFQKGTRCATCYFESVKGENSPHWNPNLTGEDREKNRKYPEYEEWRISVYRRDHFTCQCCGYKNGAKLNAHHLNSHDWAIDLRTDIDNGITLCDICHTDFHLTYGYGNNTKEQFEEYIEEILSSAI